MTTNLISRSVGDVMMESGNGTPDHVAPKGSLYIDEDNGQWYNSNGDGTWVLNGEIDIQQTLKIASYRI